MVQVSFEFQQFTNISANRWRYEMTTPVGVFEPSQDDLWSFKVRATSSSGGYGGITSSGHKVLLDGREGIIFISPGVDSEGWQSGTFIFDPHNKNLSSSGPTAFTLVMTFVDWSGETTYISGVLEVYWNSVDLSPPSLEISVPLSGDVVLDEDGDGIVPVLVIGRAIDYSVGGSTVSGLRYVRMNGNNVTFDSLGKFEVIIEVIAEGGKAAIRVEAEDAARNVSALDISVGVVSAYEGWQGGGIADKYDPNWRIVADKPTSVKVSNSRVLDCKPKTIIEIEKSSEPLLDDGGTDFLIVVRREGEVAPAGDMDGIRVWPPLNATDLSRYSLRGKIVVVSDSIPEEGKTYSYSVFAYKTYPKWSGATPSAANPYSGFPSLNPSVVGGTINRDTISVPATFTFTGGRSALMYGSGSVLAYYSFEDNLRDGSGKEADMRAGGSGDPVTYSDGGPDGKWMLLNRGTYIRSGGRPKDTIWDSSHKPPADITGEFSIVLIVKTDTTLYSPLASRQAGSGDEVDRQFIVAIIKDEGKVVFTVFGDNGKAASKVSITPVNDEKVHTIICAYYPGKSMEIYIDGISDAEDFLYDGVVTNVDEMKNPLRILQYKKNALKSASLYACAVDSKSMQSLINAGYKSSSTSSLYFRSLSFGGNGYCSPGLRPVVYIVNNDTSGEGYPISAMNSSEFRMILQQSIFTWGGVDQITVPNWLLGEPPGFHSRSASSSAMSYSQGQTVRRQVIVYPKYIAEAGGNSKDTSTSYVSPPSPPPSTSGEASPQQSPYGVTTSTVYTSLGFEHPKTDFAIVFTLRIHYHGVATYSPYRISSNSQLSTKDMGIAGIIDYSSNINIPNIRLSIKDELSGIPEATTSIVNGVQQVTGEQLAPTGLIGLSIAGTKITIPTIAYVHQGMANWKAYTNQFMDERSSLEELPSGGGTAIVNGIRITKGSFYNEIDIVTRSPHDSYMVLAMFFSKEGQLLFGSSGYSTTVYSHYAPGISASKGVKYSYFNPPSVLPGGEWKLSFEGMSSPYYDIAVDNMTVVPFDNAIAKVTTAELASTIGIPSASPLRRIMSVSDLDRMVAAVVGNANRTHIGAFKSSSEFVSEAGPPPNS
jgi:hypothetical protein